LLRIVEGVGGLEILCGLGWVDGVVLLGVLGGEAIVFHQRSINLVFPYFVLQE
jgi:hypothetical protein